MKQADEKPFFEPIYLLLKHSPHGLTLSGLDVHLSNTHFKFHQRELRGYIQSLVDLGLIRMKQNPTLPGQPYLFFLNSTVDDARKLRESHLANIVEEEADDTVLTRLVAAQDNGALKENGCPECSADMVPHGGSFLCVRCGFLEGGEE